MQAKIIKTEEEYNQTLNRIDELMDALPDTPDGHELELLVTLIEIYENEKHTIDLPDAISAIKFRMDQQNLKQKDLIRCIGSGSKVSEVLSGKRSLSLSMIRKLNAELGIPVDVLLQKPDAELPEVPKGIVWSSFPLAEIIKRDWVRFDGSLAEAKENIEELLGEWAAPLGRDALQPILLKQHMRGRKNASEHALAAWRIRTSLLAQEQNIPDYKPDIIDEEFMRDLVKLSYFDDGPLLAKEFLLKNGIHFVVEPHLPKTHLDGAAMHLPDGSPVIAMTIRYDRLDNFWFTLCHELAHLALHLGKEDWDLFFDDFDCSDQDDIEDEADAWASAALIPTNKWNKFKLTPRPTSRRVKAFAENLRIHPAIPAGHIRREKKNYRLLTDLIGGGTVRHFFSLAS